MSESLKVLQERWSYNAFRKSNMEQMKWNILRNFQAHDTFTSKGWAKLEFCRNFHRTSMIVF